jgi:hypothetical protein
MIDHSSIHENIKMYLISAVLIIIITSPLWMLFVKAKIQHDKENPGPLTVNRKMIMPPREYTEQIPIYVGSNISHYIYKEKHDDEYYVLEVGSKLMKVSKQVYDENEVGEVFKAAEGMEE